MQFSSATPHIAPAAACAAYEKAIKGDPGIQRLMGGKKAEIQKERSQQAQVTLRALLLVFSLALGVFRWGSPEELTPATHFAPDLL